MTAHRHVLTALTVVVSLSLNAGCDEDKKPQAAAQPSASAAEPKQEASPSIDESSLGAMAALPEVMKSDDNPITDAKVELGRMLYFETRISKSHQISCNTCHDLEKFGIDTRDKNAVSLGHQDQPGTRNSPTVYNAAGHFAQFWDARAKDVEEQAKGPVLNPVEMAMPDADFVIETLKSMPEYVAAFEKAFPEDGKEAVTFDNFGKAVGAFERKLTTPSRWDAFLGGKKDALTDEEKRGFNEFVSAGCTTCHNGAYMGGQMLQKLGAVKPWPNQKDQGRFEETKKDSDKMMFKVPSLRNIEKTAPYFHDGSAKTLDQAVTMMAEHQLGKKLTDQQVASIVTWLKALTGELPKQYIQKPDLPPSTDKTPKPDPAAKKKAEAAAEKQPEPAKAE